MRERVETGPRIDQGTEGVPDVYYQAFREGNLSYPQRGMGIVAMTAAAAIADPHFNAERFSAATWSSEQIVDIRRDMERAHASREVVPRREVTDARLHQLWRATNDGVIDVVGILCGLPYHRRQVIPAHDPNVLRRRELESSVRAHTLALALKDPVKMERVKRMLNSFTATLRAEAATGMGKEIREVVTEKNDRKNTEIYQRLFNRVVTEYEKESGDRLTFDELEGLRGRLAL